MSAADGTPYKTLSVEFEGFYQNVWLNRPNVKNAMSLEMVDELTAVFENAKEDPQVRAIVLRGKEGHFCAGGDIKDMANARSQALAESDSDPYFAFNRAFGRMITLVDKSPVVVVAVLEGAVLGGGFGLACVSDVAISQTSAKFGLPETGLGIPPAQIAPFVVQRIGMTQARKLALLGSRFDGNDAKKLGIVHDVFESEEQLETWLGVQLKSIQKCAPGANQATKAILHGVRDMPLEALLDYAAEQFSQCIQGKEGQEGTLAFVQKRKPFWAEGSE